MPKLTPCQEVKERFGSKEQLAKQLIPMLERDENIDQDEFEQRIRTASNKQLLRLHRVQETIKRRFGSKGELVKLIEKAKFPNGNEDYRKKLDTLRPSRLLNLFGQQK